MMMNNNYNMMNNSNQMMMMMNNKNMINNNPMMKNNNIMNNNQIMSFNQMMNNNNQMNNKNQMVNNNQMMNNNQMINNSQMMMNNNNQMSNNNQMMNNNQKMNNNQMNNNNQIKMNNNQMMMMNNNQMINTNQKLNNNNKMMNNNQMMMMNNNQMKNNNNQMMMNNNNIMMNNNQMINNNQILNNNNKMMNNNQMMMMNNINNSIYNNNQNSNILDDNEKQEQLLEIDYMRKKINIYKERIKTLEELIKQKDFEIDNLKNRLSSNFCNNQNMQPINYNPMMMMEQMNNFKNKIENCNNEINDNDNNNNNYNNNNNNKAINEKENDIVKNLTLNFSFHGTNVHIQCQSNEKMKSIIKKFSAKAALEVDSYCFLCKGKKVIDNLTIDENGIFDKDLILVFEITNKILAENKKDETQMKSNPDLMINLLFNLEGKCILVDVSKNSRFSEAVEQFVMKAGIQNKEDLHFLYKSKKLESNENRTIQELFKESNNIRIEAIYTSGVIGA